MARPRSPIKRRNLTIALEEEVARWARVKAAEADTSVARLVGDLLKEKMRAEADYEKAMREHFALVKPAPRTRRKGRLPSREELHDRAGLRS